MEIESLAEEISKSIEQGNIEGVKSALSSVHPSEIAFLLHSLVSEEGAKVLDALDADTASEVILELEGERRQEALAGLGYQKIAAIVRQMDSDDAADLISELPRDVAQRVLSTLPADDAIEYEKLLKYPDDAAGGIMQTELVEIQSTSTVRDTINWIRLIADEVEDVYEIYVTDEGERLLGEVSLKKLILANPMIQVGELIDPVPVTTTPYVDQEEVANIFKKYDIVSLPVVDEEGRLLGRITADDVLDVITEEASEDIYRFAGVGDYIHPMYTPTLSRVKLRIPWLFLTLLGELAIAFVIVHAFKTTLEKVAVLAAFMPAIMATGGNVGLQSTTIIVRGIGMGTIKATEIWGLLVSELKEGVILGLLCGSGAALLGSLISLSEPEALKLAIAIFVSMVSAVIATSFIGAAAPLLLYRMKFDPAAASGPFVTLTNDMFGSIVYLLIATMIF
ncbi:MAG: magnesium transporter [Deltaproteobacteria bacterium]